MKYKVYGIANCDSVKFVRKEFEKKSVVYDFIDFKKNPPSKELLKKWKNEWGDFPINLQGPTFRKIKTDFEKATTSDKINLLQEFPNALKRPLVEKNGKLVSVGKDLAKTF